MPVINLEARGEPVDIRLGGGRNVVRIGERAARFAMNRDRNRELARLSWAKLRQEILAAYGGKCVCCGESTPEFLSVDHIAGGGWAERKAKGPNRVYRDIRRDGFPPIYQLLCHNCNQAKGFYGTCPHQRLS